MKLSDAKNELGKIKRTSFGISVPELRKLAQKIAKNNYREFLNNNDFSSFELKLLHAFVIGYAKDDIKTLLQYFQAFIPLADRWELTDSLCQNFKIARKFPRQVWDFISQYQNSAQEFESRIVAVILLSHYLNDEYINKVIDVLNRLNTDKYYSQMAVAWALATVMGKYPQKCLTYLQSEQCCLDTSTYGKTLRKIRESYRVPQKIKELLKTMRRQTPDFIGSPGQS